VSTDVSAVSTPEAGGATTLLAMNGVSAAYGATTVLHDVHLSVPDKSIVALLGPNGAGKTTMMKLIAGIMRPSSGSITFRGVDVTRESAQARSRRGVCLIPEGRGIFRSLSVRENLRLFLPTAKREISTDEVLEIFPILGQRLDQAAGTLSGGEQQMLALSRSFLSSPGLVLLDEVSMGLAPKIVDQIFDTLSRLAQAGVSLLLVEQYVRRALDIADTAYLLNRGSIVLSGSTDQIGYDDVAALYLS